MNVRPNHLSWLELGESKGSLEDQLPDVDLFRVEAIPNYLEEIATFLAIGKGMDEYTGTQRSHMVVRVANYQLLAGNLYKLVLDEVLR